MSTAPLRAAVVGLGFMGQTHARAYLEAAKAGLPVRLAALCDADPSRLTPTASAAGNLGNAVGEPLYDPASTRTYTDLDALLVSDDIDLVSLCTHTHTHIDFAIRLLEAGKHVIIEKPVALTLAEVERLLPVAHEAESRGILCMPAMCVRYWPGWSWLREAIASRSFGSVRSAAFTRLGSTPGWADAFYKDPAKSGGAILDLHIHDTDFVHFCFGPPAEVVSTGSHEHITTLYRFADGPHHITAEGCWDRHPKAPFAMRYRVDFELASAEFDMNAPSPLMLYTDSGAEPLQLPASTGWELAIHAFVRSLSQGDTRPPITVDDAATVMRTIEAERASLSTGRPVAPAAR